MKANIPIPQRQPMPLTTESIISADTHGMMKKGKKLIAKPNVLQRAVVISEMMMSFRMFVPVWPIVYMMIPTAYMPKFMLAAQRIYDKT